jgi:hypothetical protein
LPVFCEHLVERGTAIILRSQKPRGNHVKQAGARQDKPDRLVRAAKREAERTAQPQRKPREREWER